MNRLWSERYATSRLICMRFVWQFEFVVIWALSYEDIDYILVWQCSIQCTVFGKIWISWLQIVIWNSFYRAAWNANAVLRWDFCPSVCPSVCLSVKSVHCDKTEERYVLIFISHERTFILVLWEEEWLVGDDPFYPKFWLNRTPLERNRRFWTDNRS